MPQVANLRPMATDGMAGGLASAQPENRGPRSMVGSRAGVEGHRWSDSRGVGKALARGTVALAGRRS